MAITTLDGLIAGFQAPWSIYKVGSAMEAAGVPHSFFYSAGFPGAGSAPSPGIDGAAITSVTGQLFYDNPSGGNYGYLARFAACINASNPGVLLLCDRLWHNSGIAPATTTGQSITSAALPARDRNGSTNGEDVMFAIEVSTATTNGSAITNTTLSYVNSDNTGGTRTATIPSFPATAVAGTFVPFVLQAGDKGIRSISSITLGTSYAPSGSPAIHLIGYRILARIAMLGSNSGVEVDAISGGLTRLYDNTCPFLVYIPTATSAVNIHGSITYAHG